MKVDVEIQRGGRLELPRNGAPLRQIFTNFQKLSGRDGLCVIELALGIPFHIDELSA